MRPAIILHDVLQASLFSKSQIVIFKDKTPFQWFNEAISSIPSSYKLKLAVLPHGIDIYPEWVEMIKEHKWEVQSHGYIHHEMQHLSEKDVYDEIRMSVYLLEDTFKQRITEFYPPRLKTSNAMYEACKKLGINLMMNRYRIDDFIMDNTVPNFYLHYWSERQLKLCRQLAKQ